MQPHEGVTRAALPDAARAEANMAEAMAAADLTGVAGDCTELQCLDEAELRRFLHLIDEGAEVWHWRALPGSAPNYTGTVEQALPWLRARNAEGRGLFVVINEGGHKARDITRVRAVFADLDGAPLGPVMGCGLEPHAIAETSPDRWHVYWLVDGLALDQFEGVQRTIAGRFGGDSSIHDLPRIMRLPGSWNRKAEPWPVKVIHQSGALPFDAETILAAFPPKVSRPKESHAERTNGSGQASIAANDDSAASEPPAGVELPPDDRQLAELRSALTALHADDRDQWVRIGLALKTGGDRCRSLWIEWSQTSDKWRPEDARQWDTFKPDRTNWRTVFDLAQQAGWINPASNAALTKAPNTGRRSASFRLAPFAEMVANIEPPTWLVRGFIELLSVAFLIGKWGSCKSFLAIDFAMCVVTGTPWHGCRVTQGAVVYLCGEGHTGVRRRLAAWARHHGLQDADVPLWLSTRAIRLDAAGVADVAAALEAVGVGEFRLLIIDTMHRHYIGEEVDNDQFGIWLEGVEAISKARGAAVLIVHHEGHAAPGRGRGASAQGGAADHVFVLAADSTATPDAPVVTLTTTKQKDSEPHPPITFALRKVALPDVLDEDDRPVTSAVLATTDPGPDPATAKLGANQFMVVQALRRLEAKAAAAGITGVTVQELRHEANVSAKRWPEAYRGLLDRGVVAEVNGMVTFRTRSSDPNAPL